ncbi:glycoside hydrolase superfamily [Paraphoma chrysanthemicola]|uniref:Alpha-galactosidase n=1 Tax=Paraphoma chrysanthemicola TaxID=798071 RepID=A0A8K0W3Z2_9PLEO|nr:glycoside hydrolase superfamily [Paraphoma chrysanthemicola]
MPLRLSILGLALLPSSFALVSRDGHTGRLPAMGWNSWNEYECAINETVFLTVGELLVSLGLKDLGYNHVNIDDCWSDKVKKRDNVTGKILPDYTKFPQGIKHTADEIHKLGLKLGIYGDAGSLTCGGFAGSLGHEELDAKTWAEWGIDYLKYDNCNVPDEWDDDYRWWPENWLGGPPAEDQTAGGDGEAKPVPAPAGYDWTTSKSFDRYKIMGDALLASNRTIEYSQCAWGHARIDEWGDSTGHSWRMWGDIYPIWSGKFQWSWGLMPILNHASFFYNSSNFWGHADFDMLEVGNGNLTLEESRSHFALWAALKSPLIIGTPLDGIKPEILKILSNKDLIAFNQDPVVGEPAKPYKWGVNPNFTWNQTHPAEYWSGKSSKGVHVFALNTLDTTQKKTIDFSEVPGLDARTKYIVYDSWTGKKQGVFKKKYEARVKSHDTLAIRIVKEDGSRPY